MRVRFPSPAPHTTRPKLKGIPQLGPSHAQTESGARAIRVLLGIQHSLTRRLVIAVAPNLVLDHLAQPRCDLTSPLVGRVLVDQGRPHGRVPHPVHQLASRRTPRERSRAPFDGPNLFADRRPRSGAFDRRGRGLPALWRDQAAALRRRRTSAQGEGAMTLTKPSSDRPVADSARLTTGDGLSSVWSS